MASGSWIPTTGGAWNNNANWTGASFPDALTDAATLATDITADATVTMGKAISVGSMTFSDNGASGNAWTIAPGGAFSLTLGTSTITTTTNATISAAVAGTAAITKAGAATLTLSGGGTNTGAWAINAGTLAVTTAALTATTGAITVGSSGLLTIAAGIDKPLIANGNVTHTSGTLTNNTLIGNDAGSVVKYTLNSGASIITTLSGSKFLTFAVNASSRVAFYQTGNVSVTGVPSGTYAFQRGINFGEGNSSQAYCYWRGTGGSIATTNNSFVMLGFSYPTTAGGSPFVGDIDGTTLALNRTLVVGNSTNGSAVLNILSGTHTLGSGSGGVLGFAALDGATNVSGAATTQQRLTLLNSGTSFTSSSVLDMRASATGALSQINLHSGTALSVVGAVIEGATPKQINLINGGKFSVAAPASPTFTVTASNVKILLYGNGNKIGAGTSSTAFLPLEIANATGSGVTSISNPGGNAGAGYIGPPVVVLTGGGGTGASARAVWNSATQTITGFEVTNPGVGYTSAPTVVLSGATLANNCCTTEVNPALITVSIGANSTDGTIEKTETGTLALTAANTFTGAATVSQGTLRIGNGGAAGTLGNNDASNAIVASNAVLAFGRSDARTYSSIISGAGTITVNGGNVASRATLSGVNTFTSAAAAISIAANSVLRVTNSDSIGQGISFGVTVNNTGVFELDGTSGAITGLPAKALSLAGTGISTGGALRNIAGNNSYSGAITLAAASRINSDAGTLSLNAATAITGATVALTFGGASNITVNQAINTTTGTVTKDGAGFTSLAASNSSYTGKTTVAAGTLGYATAAAAGSVSSFGASSGASSTVDIAAGAGIRFTGSTPQSFTRTINSTANAAGAVLRVESDGSAAVTHSTVFTNTTTNQTRTYQFGGSGTANNSVSFVIANNGTGAVSVTKADFGKWVLSGANTYTGNTTVSAGTLVASSETGAARFGASNTVTVANGAKIQTLKGTNQNGRHTYNNLTFSAGGSIRIGG